MTDTTANRPGGEDVSTDVDVLVQPLPSEVSAERAGSVPPVLGEAPYPYPPTTTTNYMNQEYDEAQSSQMYSQEAPSSQTAHPPPQVMTALGPMPLPPEIRSRIPEKFVAKPIIEEREIYIAKKEVQERTIEVPHVHYEHKFTEVPKSLKIKKLVPQITQVVKEIPREVYKPVIEEKVIEVPQGVKYVEVPVEVPCLYPPKIVPKPKIQIVERVVETIKPVVKEKIIEVPQTVVKQIPKIKTVQVPYYVPRYVEKIIEIPYQPSDSTSLPPILHGALPNTIMGQIPLPGQHHMGPMPLNQVGNINVPYEAQIDIKISQNAPEGYSDPSGVQRATTLTSGDGRTPNIDLPQGFVWGAPSNAPRDMMNPGGCYPAPVGDPRMANMPPMMVTCPPEVGKVNFAGYLTEPDILTRQGVMPYQGFKSGGNFQMLFPPLAPQANVPMTLSGTPDVQTIEQAHSYMANQTTVMDTLGTELEESQNASCSLIRPCAPGQRVEHVYYEQ